MENVITLEIILVTPPAETDYGIQEGHGNDIRVIQIQRSTGKDLHFKFDIKIKKAKNNDPDFSGPFVQGPVGQRFVYIGIGSFTGQINAKWSRRLKIPLQSISWDMITQQQKNQHVKILATASGTGRDGTPSCGTIKPFDGWKLVS